MGYVRSKFHLFKKDSDAIGDTTANTWSSSPVELPNASLKNIRVGLGDKKDQFSIQLNNVSNQYYGSAVDYYGLSEDDRIKIYMWRDRTSLNESTDLVIDGTISSVEEEITPEGRVITINGTNFIEVLFNGIIPYTSGGTPKNFINHISSILSQLQSFNQSRKIEMHPSNPTTKQDGTAFPTFPFATNYTNIHLLIEDLVSDDHTGDGQYIYYVTTASDTFYLKIVPKSSTVSTSFTEGSINDDGYVPAEIKVSRTTEDVVNFVIFNAGGDLEGNYLEFPEFDAVSIANVGIHGYYLTDTSNIFEQIYLDELKADTSHTLFNYESGGQEVVTRNSADPYPKSYNYTFQFNTRSGEMEDYSGSSVGSPATANSDNNFNAILRIEAEARARQIARNMILRFKNPRLRANLLFPFFNELSVGSLINLTVPSYNLQSYPLRITEMIYSPGTLELVAEEDESTAEYT